MSVSAKSVGQEDGVTNQSRDSVRFVNLRVSTSLRTCLPSQQFYKHAERLLPHSFWVSTSDKHTERLSYLWVWCVNLSWKISLASSWFRTRTNSEPVLNVWVYAFKEQGILLRRGVPIPFEIFPFNHWNLTRPSHIDFSHHDSEPSLRRTRVRRTIWSHHPYPVIKYSVGPMYSCFY